MMSVFDPQTPLMTLYTIFFMEVLKICHFFPFLAEKSHLQN
jgi:hypothetical protein